MPVPTQISDGHRIASIDHNNNTLVNTPSDHLYIHDGSAYYAEISSSVSSGTTYSISFKTPIDKQVHLTYEVVSELLSHIYFYEDTQITGGNEVDVFNANRNYADSSEMIDVVNNASITKTGAKTLSSHFFGFEGVNTIKTGRKWVLKENTTYSMEVDNLAGEGNRVIIKLDWYEHTPKTD